MYKKLQPDEVKKIISSIKISSILIQFTFLVFPLSMYIVYNKVVSNNNPSSLIVIVSFLTIVLGIQLILKIYESIQQNLLKTHIKIENHKSYFNNKLKTPTNDNDTNNSNSYNASDINVLNKLSDGRIQNIISDAYYIFIAIYLLLVLIIGGPLIIVPLCLFSLNYLIAKKSAPYIAQANKQHANAFNKKSTYIKDMLTHIRSIKGLNCDNNFLNNYNQLANTESKYKCYSLYTQQGILRASIVINILNIAFTLILGRYLFSLEILTIQDIVTCTLLTVWISRSLGQIFINIANSENTNKINDVEYLNKNQINDTFSFTEQDPKKVTSEDYSAIINELNNSQVIFCNSNSNICLKQVYKLLQDDYINTAYISSKTKIFYGSIIDNIILFDNTKKTEAIKILGTFNLANLIDKLPYQLNYVIHGDNDEVVPSSILIAIALARELLKKPDVLIIDINLDQIDDNIKKGLVKYTEMNDIHLIVKHNKVTRQANNTVPNPPVLDESENTEATGINYDLFKPKDQSQHENNTTNDNAVEQSEFQNNSIISDNTNYTISEHELPTYTANEQEVLEYMDDYFDIIEVPGHTTMNYDIRTTTDNHNTEHIDPDQFDKIYNGNTKAEFTDNKIKKTQETKHTDDTDDFDKAYAQSQDIQNKNTVTNEPSQENKKNNYIPTDEEFDF